MATSAPPRAPIAGQVRPPLPVAGRPRPHAGASLPPGWPLLLLFGGYPLWWVLGLAPIIWIVAAVPMLAWLLVRPGVRVPKGFGLWLAFLFWMLLSATQLEEARRWYAFSYRALLYLSMTVTFVYLYNLPRSSLPARRVVAVLAGFWAAVILLGFVALTFPHVTLTTPVSLLLPAGLADNPFVDDLVGAKLAQVQTFVGYALPRPAAPFTYTNEWGGSVSLLTATALAGLSVVRSCLARNLIRLLLVASLVPIVVSANRGLWVALGVGLVYAAVRVALRGNAGTLGAVVGLLTLVALLVSFTPLERYVADRLANPHSNERRARLDEQAVRGALDSPWLGYGGPRESEETPNAPDVGTHGQFFLVLFSHGLPGTACFLAWWLWVLWGTARGATGPPLWLHVALVMGAVQFFYYDMLPTQLYLMMVFAALAWRERQPATPSSRPATPPIGNR